MSDDMSDDMTLFHCNDEKRCLIFFSSDSYMIISQEDGKWLGSGMRIKQNWKLLKMKKQLS